MNSRIKLFNILHTQKNKSIPEKIVTLILLGLMLLGCTDKQGCHFASFDKFQYCYTFPMVSQEKETQILYLENFDYTSREDLIKIQKFALYYKSKHGRRTKYPFTGLLILDKYYPVVDMLEFKGVTVRVFFENENKPPQISYLDIYKGSRKLSIEIPTIPVSE